MKALAEYYGIDLESAIDVLEEYVDLTQHEDADGAESIAYILLEKTEGSIVGVEFIEEQYFPFDAESETYDEMVENLKNTAYREQEEYKCED